jgi:hypothetical protein
MAKQQEPNVLEWGVLLVVGWAALQWLVRDYAQHALSNLTPATEAPEPRPMASSVEPTTNATAPQSVQSESGGLDTEYWRGPSIFDGGNGYGFN